MKRLYQILFIVFILVSLQTINAQNPPPPPDGGINDETPGNVDDVPINILVYPFLFLGAYIGYRFIKKSTR